jgi:hypothetical protein
VRPEKTSTYVAFDLHLNCIYHENKLNGKLSHAESGGYLLSSYSFSSLDVAIFFLLAIRKTPSISALRSCAEAGVAEEEDMVVRPATLASASNLSSPS